MFSPPLAEIREKRCGSSRRTLPDQGFAPKRFRPSHVLANARALDVANRINHYLSHPEIAGGKRIYQQLRTEAAAEWGPAEEWIRLGRFRLLPPPPERLLPLFGSHRSRLAAATASRRGCSRPRSSWHPCA